MLRTFMAATVAVTLAGLSFATPVQAAPDGWHGSLKDGLEASAKSGKPLLLITAWAKTI